MGKKRKLEDIINSNFARHIVIPFVFLLLVVAFINFVVMENMAGPRVGAAIESLVTTDDINITAQIRTLKDEYTINEVVNLTDPPLPGCPNCPDWCTSTTPGIVECQPPSSVNDDYCVEYQSLYKNTIYYNDTDYLRVWFWCAAVPGSAADGKGITTYIKLKDIIGNNLPSQNIDQVKLRLYATQTAGYNTFPRLTDIGGGWWEVDITSNYTYWIGGGNAYFRLAPQQIACASGGATGTNRKFSSSEVGAPNAPKFVISLTGCTPGEAILCGLQQGICDGSYITCPDNGVWPLCNETTYSNYDPNYQVDETICDGLDNDCDGSRDEGFTNETCSYVCTANGFDWSGNGGNLNCCGNNINEGSPYEAGEISCSDGSDNDCDGTIDNCLPPCPIGTNLCDDGFCRAVCSGFNCIVNGSCDNDEGCECSDCDGLQDSCESDSICFNNICTLYRDTIDYNLTYLVSPISTAAYGYMTGILNNINYDSLIYALKLINGQNSGTYTSQVFDAGSNSSWKNISWVIGGVYGQELFSGMVGNILLMHMNEVGGIIIDNSGIGNNGTYNGVLYSQDGKINTAIGFDGIDDAINIGDTQDLTEITMSAWIKVDETGYNYIIGKSSTALGQGLHLRIGVGSTDSRIRCFTGDASSSFVNSINSVSIGQWSHVVCTDDGSEISVYINGVLDNSESSSGIVNNNNNLTIGDDPIIVNNFFKGTIDEVAIWDRVLSPEEILNNYKMGILRLDIEVRSCDDDACLGEDWINIDDSLPQDLNVLNNTYFQYKVDFETDDILYGPELYNISINYQTIVPPKTTPEENQSKIYHNSSSAVSVNVTLKVQYNNGTSWIDEDTIVENQQETIAAGSLLPLDTIWNQIGWNTSNVTSHGYGVHNYSAVVIANYNGQDVIARHLFTVNVPDIFPPDIMLNSPNNNQILENGVVIINWSVEDNSYNVTCNLTIDGVVNISNIEIEDNNPIIDSFDFTKGMHNWNVECVDNIGYYANSETRSFGIVCDVGEQLCSDGTCSFNCSDTDGDVAGCIGNPNGICEIGEGCNCSDCDEERSLCGYGYVCDNSTVSCEQSLKVELVNPNDGLTWNLNNITLICNATSYYHLTNMTLYTDRGVWGADGINVVSGNYNQTNFTLTNLDDRLYNWNCKGYDDSGLSDMADSNRNFTIVSRYCGSNVVDPGEECDGGIGDFNCTRFDNYNGGTLSCNITNCMFNFSGCDGGTLRNCSNGVAEGNESCDGNDLNGFLCTDFDAFRGGYLTCTDDCYFNTSMCSLTSDCGNGVLNPGEQCDLNVGSFTCTDLDSYNGGVLSCGDDCMFDTSACTGGITPADCGNGIVESGETCDLYNFTGLLCANFDSFTGGTLICDNCQIDTSQCNNVSDCGNGIIDDGEMCDDGNLGVFNCQSFGFTGGVLRCDNNCQFNSDSCTGSAYNCSNGVIDAGELCDGNNLNGYLCSDFDNFAGGILSCAGNCNFDTSLCSLTSDCGNGVVNAGEQCDNGIGNFECNDFDGYNGGTLNCYDNCTFNLSACTGGTSRNCSNGIADGDETCDGSDLNGLLCTNFDAFSGGLLTCNGNCQINTSMCSLTSLCGNGEVNAGEQCDSGVADFNCTIFDGYNGGTLGCDNNCMFDLSGCNGGTPRNCSNGVANGDETCDGSDLNGLICNNFNSFDAGNLVCTNDCQINTSSCYIISCGDGNCDSPKETCSNCAADCGQCNTGGGSGGGGGGCTNRWECSEWGNCVEGVQFRTCTDTNRCRTEINKPIENQTCVCSEDWICSEWPECGPGGKQTRICEDWNACGTTSLKPSTETSCTYIPPVVVVYATCYDGIRNQGEADVDCGGPCKPCPSCDDGIKNQGESGIDCGGPCSPCPEVPKGMSWWFVILLWLLIIVLIGGAGFTSYYYWPQISHRFDTLMASSKIGRPEDLLEVETYAQRMEDEGYGDQQIINALGRAGWNEEQIHMVIHKVHKPTGNLVNMIDYIKKCRRLGYSDDKTKLMLLKVGWPAVQISKVFEMKTVKRE